MAVNPSSKGIVRNRRAGLFLIGRSEFVTRLKTLLIRVLQENEQAIRRFGVRQVGLFGLFRCGTVDTRVIWVMRRPEDELGNWCKITCRHYIPTAGGSKN